MVQRETRAVVEANLATSVPDTDHHAPMMKYLDWLEKFAVMADWRTTMMMEAITKRFDDNAAAAAMMTIKDMGQYETLTRTFCKYLQCMLDRKQKFIILPIGRPHVQGCERVFEECFMVYQEDLFTLWKLVTHNGTFAHLVTFAMRTPTAACDNVSFEKILTIAWSLHEATGQLVLALESSRYYTRWNGLYTLARHGIEQVRCEQQRQIAQGGGFSPIRSRNMDDDDDAADDYVDDDDIDYGTLADAPIVLLPFPIKTRRSV